MYPDSDSRADQFDDAFERRQTGDDTPVEDSELQDLLTLATQLERDLPDDIPDPAFRESLKQQLLSGQSTAQEPVNLTEERWHRRLAASPWRLSAAAAAFLVTVVVVIVMGMGTLGTDGDSDETVSFQALDDEPEVSDEELEPLDVQEMVPRSQRWRVASFPPFDHEHMVLPPTIFDLLTFGAQHEPEVELNGALEMVNDAEMPETATVYYLSAPPDPETMLTTLRATLNIDGEFVPGNDDGVPHQMVNEDDEPVMLWDSGAAFFHFRGDLLDEPLTDLTDDEAEPVEAASAFLELIGFDLYTIEYEATVTENGNLNEVRFFPVDMPETGMEVTLGGTVSVDSSGAINEAQLYWLSLVDTRDVRLRTAEEVIEAVENGNGYSPPVSEANAEMMIEVAEMTVVHVLTRLDEASFILQPAVKFLGDYGTETESELPGPARYFIPAAADDD